MAEAEPSCLFKIKQAVDEMKQSYIPGQGKV